MAKSFLKIIPICLGMMILTLQPQPTYSCTRVFANDKGKILATARSMDLFISDTPLLVTQPRGTSQSGDAGTPSLTWISKYGNLAVTAFRTNAVSDGINEKGLAVHLLYLIETQYPPVEKSAAKISNAKWARYILDNFATVNEALEGTKNLPITATVIHGQTWPAHLAIEDATGDSAVIEFIKGKMQVYHGPQYRIMTNEPAYHIQLSNLNRYISFGGALSLPGDTDPLSRFVRVATYLKTLPPSQNQISAIANVLSVIRSAMVPFGALDTSGNKTTDAWSTRWVSVADVTNKIYYFNSTTAPNIIWVDLKKINFEKGTAAFSIDPTQVQLEGDVTKQFMPE